MKELSTEEAFNKAAALCAGAEHCRSEIAAKLEKWAVPPAAAGTILDRLEQERYIDEARYARFYAHDKLRYNRWGRLKINQGLRQKLIPADIIADALAALDENEYLEAVKSVLNAKQRSVKGRNAYERRMKLLRYAAGKGFEPSLVSPLIHLEADENGMDEDW